MGDVSERKTHGIAWRAADQQAPTTRYKHLPSGKILEQTTIQQDSVGKRTLSNQDAFPPETKRPRIDTAHKTVLDAKANRTHEYKSRNCSQLSPVNSGGQLVSQSRSRPWHGKLQQALGIMGDKFADMSCQLPGVSASSPVVVGGALVRLLKRGWACLGADKQQRKDLAIALVAQTYTSGLLSPATGTQPAMTFEDIATHFSAMVDALGVQQLAVALLLCARERQTAVQLQAALRLCRRAVAADPESLEAWLTLAQLTRNTAGSRVCPVICPPTTLEKLAFGSHLSPAMCKDAELLPNSHSPSTVIGAVQHCTAAGQQKEDLAQVESHLHTALQVEASSPEEVTMQRTARSLLALFLCQEGRDTEAAVYLKQLGCRYRLSSQVLHYRLPSQPLAAATGRGVAGDAARYVAAVDGALSASMLQHMRAGLAADSKFWSEHDYHSGTTGYFSFAHRLEGSPESSLDQVIRHIHALVCQHFPRAAEARFAEWWAHCRPHPSGHQLHFDSDNEGIGEVRNPIVSSVLYLTGETGGPTLVTPQRLADTQLGNRGWLVFPRENRLAMFDGGVLHGVIPGRSFADQPHERRVTFMVAFWPDLKIRPRSDGKPGASQPFPAVSEATHCSWPGMFKLRAEPWGRHKTTPAEVFPVSQVWDDVDEKNNKQHGCALNSLTTLPKYDTCFQGF